MTPARADWLLRRWLPHWLDLDGWRDHRAALVAGTPDALDRAWEAATAQPWTSPPLPAADARRWIMSTLPELDGPAGQAISVAHYATRVLPIEAIEALVESCPRPPGRPAVDRVPPRKVSILLPPELAAQVEATAQALGVTAGETYRRAIAAGLPIVAPKDDGDHNCRVVTSVLR